MLKKNDPNDIFSLTKLLLRVGGISLDPRNDSTIYRVYTCFVISFNLFVLLQFIGIPRYLRTDKDVFEFVLYQAILFIMLLKSIVMLYNRQSLGNILKKFESVLLKPNTERGGTEEKLLIEGYTARAKRQSMVYWCIIMSTVISGFCDALASRLTNKELVWRYEYGPFTIFNATNSPNFEIAFMVQNTAWIILSFTFCTSEVLIISVLAHLTCQLKVLQNAIERIVLNSHKKMMKDMNLIATDESHNDMDASKIPWSNLQSMVEEIVRHHLTIINIAEDTERIFNLIVLIILLSVIVITAGCLYRIALVHVLGVFCQLGEAGVICYWGNEVSLESIKVMDACYRVNFFGSDLRFQKSMLLVMERSKRPIIFTAGKFSPLTLATFIWIARATYSFLLVLRRMT